MNMGMFTAIPPHKKVDRTLRMCQLPSDENQLLVILGHDRVIQN